MVICSSGAVLESFASPSCFFLSEKKKKSCRDLSLDSTDESLHFSICLGISVTEDSILASAKTGMLFLKNRIDNGY